MRPRVTTFVTLTVHLVFVLMVAFGGPCLDRCPDDGPDERCPPACWTCPCAPKAGAVAPARALAAPTASASAVEAVVVGPPVGPEPGDIFHVPKRLLA
jgi:hypothetical protein